MFCFEAKFLVISQDRTASPGRKRLIAVKTKDGKLPMMANMATFIAGSERFSRILNKRDLVFFTHPLNGIKVRRMSECMHRDQNLNRASGASVAANATADFSNAGKILLQRLASPEADGFAVHKCG